MTRLEKVIYYNQKIALAERGREVCFRVASQKPKFETIEQEIAFEKALAMAIDQFNDISDDAKENIEAVTKIDRDLDLVA